MSAGGSERRSRDPVDRRKGDYAGFWAVTVRADWRVIFRFEEGDAVDVDYLDDH